MMSRKAWLLGSAAAALLFAGPQAYAQSGAASMAAAAAAATPATVEVGEVIVTAEKRSQSIQKVPSAVTAFTSVQRDLQGITTLQDMSNFTPGLNYNASIDRVYIRGIGRNTNNLATDPGVATYVDGVYNSSTIGASNDSMFVDRLEVLRGPEGTLYGRNSIGGAMNAISRRPTDEFSGEVRADIANYDRYMLEGTISGPITDGLKFRLGANYTEQDQGYFKSLNGLPSEGGTEKPSYYIEGQLQARFGDKFDAWVKVADRYYDATNRSSAIIGPLDYSPEPTGTSGPGGNFALCGPAGTCGVYPAPTNVVTLPGTPAVNPTSINLRDFATNIPASAIDKDDYQIAGEAVWHLTGADLKYIGGFHHYYYDSKSSFQNTGVLTFSFPCFSYPPGAAPGYGAFLGCTPQTYSAQVETHYVENKTFYSNELNLTSTGNGPLQWILGLYDYGEHYDQPVDYPVLGGGDAVLNTIGTTANPTHSIDFYDTHLNINSYAVFGQVDWKATDTLKFTGGLRYTYDQKSGVEYTRQTYIYDPGYGQYVSLFLTTPGANPGYGYALPTPSAGTGAQAYNSVTGYAYRYLGAHWGAVTGTAGVEWTPAEHNMLYAKYSRGYKSGGFDTGFLEQDPETQPEYVDAFEVGYKGNIAHQLQFDAAAFYYNYSQDQVPILKQFVGEPGQIVYYNLPGVRTYGLELESIWNATKQLTFNLSYSYLNTDITNDGGCQFNDPVDAAAVQPAVNQAGCTTAQKAAGQMRVQGYQLAQSPHNKIALNAMYRFDFEPGSLTFSGSYIWTDRFYSSFMNRSYNLSPAFDQVDLRALWTDTKKRYTVIAYAKNVFNTLGYNGVAGVGVTTIPPGTTPGVDSSLGLLPPRTYGVEVQYRF
jgi:iron complex outermembrane receptor protein